MNEHDKLFKQIESVKENALDLRINPAAVAALAAEVNKLSPAGGKTVMSTATRLREEGKLEGKLEDARRMLEKKLDIDLIADVTGLPREEIEALRKEIQQ